MSSYAGPGQFQNYPLPFLQDAVPTSFKSNLAPKPINCTLQTVTVPSTSGTAALGATSIIQVPLGQSAYICNPYLRFKANYAVGANALAGAAFKSASQSAMALISSYQTSINSTLVDNIQNFPQVADILLSHSCSKEWLASDGNVLMATASAPPVAATASAKIANLGPLSNGAMVANTTRSEVYCVPLFGLLSSQQALPAFAINGILQINLNWVNSAVAALSASGGLDTLGLTFSEITLVYDRVAVEGDFIARMKQEMASSGAKYCYAFTNYQTVSQASTNGQNTINVGLNVSSLRGVVMSSILTADYTTANTTGFSRPMGLTNFQVTLDGRLVNNVLLDAVNQPASCFIEMQKSFSRIFDSNVTDNSSRIEYFGIDSADMTAANGAKSFAVGVSCNRVSEGLQFQGSPVSVLGLQLTQAATTATNYIVYISDYNLLIGADGMCEIVR